MKKLFMLMLMCSVLSLSVFASGEKEKGSVSYPNSPVTIICPYSAGGGSDSVSRAIAEAAKADFPKGIAVENRTGGAGSVGMSYGMHAKPNGYMITMIAPELVMLPHTGTGGDINFKKFIPIIMVNSGYAAITVSSDSPYKTLADFVAAAKEKNLQIGNSGIGSIWHLAGAGFEQAAGIEMIHVPFDGSATAITSLLGNHIDAVSVSYAEVQSQVEAGKLRTLAVLAPSRLPECPEIATVAELGYGDLSIGTWRGFSVPVGTDPVIVEYIKTSFEKAAQTDAFKKFMKNTNNAIDIIPSDKFATKITNEDVYYGKLIESLGLSK
ncbi:MAG: tripartite tricarboxylate transporter substrate binding protein [Spirochaetaceae bacterium]|nr:tripartite tricarboxylate transporter substrate binding protein [Spirochaetaceae bacterium]